MRDAIRDCLGTVPDRPAPDPETVAREAADGFERRTVAHTVAGSERVESYLLVPEGADGAPGAVAIHSHGGVFPVGKSQPAGLTERSAGHYGAELARRGFVVVCPDLLGFEDRRPPEYRRAEGAAPEGADYEKYVAMDHLLRGSTLQARYLADLASAADLLADHDAVDESRVGALGHSLGGQEAAWLAAFDDRVTAAVASCGAAPLAAVQDAMVTHNFALYVPGFVPAGDTTALLADAAPTALLLSAGAEDPLFPVESVREMAVDVAGAYEAAGCPERFESVVVDGGHAFPRGIRERAYDFLARWA